MGKKNRTETEWVMSVSHFDVIKGKFVVLNLVRICPPGCLSNTVGQRNGVALFILPILITIELHS